MTAERNDGEDDQGLSLTFLKGCGERFRFDRIDFRCTPRPDCVHVVSVLDTPPISQVHLGYFRLEMEPSKRDLPN
jgi:hypothetical protein